MSSNFDYGDFSIMVGSVSECGSDAQIYKAKHKRYNYIRALKVFKGNPEKETDGKTNWKRMEEEAEKLFRLGNGAHPNIIRVGSIGKESSDNGTVKAYLEMDYLHGNDLFSYIASCNEFVPYTEFLNMVKDISSALAYCHHDIYLYCIDKQEDKEWLLNPEGPEVKVKDEKSKNMLIKKYRVIHNDLHSRNIFRKDDGRYILLDFGLAVDTFNHNRPSKIIGGNLLYKAPERWDNAPVDTAADIYSFGILMYEMLTGDVPFPCPNMLDPNSLIELERAHKKSPPPLIEEKRGGRYKDKNRGEEWKKDYPDWIDGFIEKCLAKKSEDRFADGREMFDYLNKKLKEETKSSADNDKTVKNPGPQTENIPIVPDDIIRPHSSDAIPALLLPSRSEKPHAWFKNAALLFILCSAILWMSVLLLEKYRLSSETNGSKYVVERKVLFGTEVAKYTGEMVNGLPHGWGQAKSTTFDYQGSFKEGKRHGQAICRFSNGHIYEGEFRLDSISGIGLYIVPGEFSYKGEFHKNMIHGYGMLFNAHGAIDKTGYFSENEMTSIIP